MVMIIRCKRVVPKRLAPPPTSTRVSRIRIRRAVVAIHRRTTHRIVRAVHQIAIHRVIARILARVVALWLNVLVGVAPAWFRHRTTIVRVVRRVTPIGRGVLRMRMLGGINLRRIVRKSVVAMVALTSGILAKDPSRIVR